VVVLVCMRVAMPVHVGVRVLVVVFVSMLVVVLVPSVLVVVLAPSVLVSMLVVMVMVVSVLVVVVVLAPRVVSLGHARCILLAVCWGTGCRWADAQGAAGAAPAAAVAPWRDSQRTTAMAAPKPLSMFTTVTPAAQLDSMPSNAASPPSDTP
jgi:hypothetical protein